MGKLRGYPSSILKRQNPQHDDARAFLIMRSIIFFINQSCNHPTRRFTIV